MDVNLTIHVKREIVLARNNIYHVVYSVHASIHVKILWGIIMKKMKVLTLKRNRLIFKCFNFIIQFMTVTTEKMAVWSFQKFHYLICTAYLAKIEILCPYYMQEIMWYGLLCWFWGSKAIYFLILCKISLPVIYNMTTFEKKIFERSFLVRKIEGHNCCAISLVARGYQSGICLIWCLRTLSKIFMQ